MNPDAACRFIGKRDLVRKNQQFVLIPGGLFRYDIELKFQLRQHAHRRFQGNIRPQFRAAASINHRDGRTVDRIQAPRVILSYRFISSADQVEHFRIVVPRADENDR